MAFTSLFIDCDQNPDFSTLDPEFYAFVGDKDKQKKEEQEDVAAIDAAMKGDSSLLNKRRTPFPTKIHQNTDFKNSFVHFDGEKVLIKSFYPKGCDPQKLPLFINIHGGGWCYSSVEETNEFCSRLAFDMNAEVVSINYSLSPEAKTGQSLKECYEVWKKFSMESSSDRQMFFVGDSSGANLALGSVFKIRENNLRMPTAMILLYPVTDILNDYESYHKFASGVGLSLIDMKKFIEAYAPNIEDRRCYYYSPILGDLHGFPPTLIIASQIDILRDQAHAFALKLNKSFVPVKYVCIERAGHGYIACSPIRKLINLAHEEIQKFMKNFQIG